MKKTSSSEDDDFLHPRKRLRTSSSRDDENTYIGDSSLWSQHIGELLVYLKKSLLNDGILGITIEKTWVYLILFTFVIYLDS